MFFLGRGPMNNAKNPVFLPAVAVSGNPFSQHTTKWPKKSCNFAKICYRVLLSRGGERVVGGS